MNDSCHIIDDFNRTDASIKHKEEQYTVVATLDVRVTENGEMYADSMLVEGLNGADKKRTIMEFAGKLIAAYASEKNWSMLAELEDRVCGTSGNGDMQ